MRFPREARLATAADFRFVFDRPDVSRDAMFRVLSRPNGRRSSRLGMAVSARACRKASQRSRLKRVIRESFRLNLAALSAQQPRDIVVLPTNEAATRCNAALFDSLQAHWKRLAEHQGRKENQARTMPQEDPR